MKITIKDELINVLDEVSTIAGKTNEEYVSYILNIHLEQKRSERLIEKANLVGYRELEQQINTLILSNKEEINTQDTNEEWIN